jgi:hypothetical protein
METTNPGRPTKFSKTVKVSVIDTNTHTPASSLKRWLRQKERFLDLGAKLIFKTYLMALQDFIY